MESDEQYLASVDDWVAREAANCTDFGELLLKLPGVYPTIAASSLERLVVTGRISRTLWRPRNHLSLRRQLSHSNCDLCLPAPHPLDYDWRFSPGAREMLLERCHASTAASDIVVFIGAPTLLGHARRNGFRREAVLLDRNLRLFEHFGQEHGRHRMIRCDVARDTLPVLARSARVVVLDPPWYPEYMEAFLWAACELTNQGSSVFMSIPPVGTRPGIGPERASVFAFAERAGLEVRSLEEGVLPYLSPPFEQAALEVEGITNLPNDWRRGDLVTFARGTQPSGARPPPPEAEGTWVEERLHGTRLRIRELVDERPETLPRLVPLAENDILSSVSRRDTRRRVVDVWTVGNRVFAAEGRAALRRLIQALNARRDPDEDARLFFGRDLTHDESRATRATIGQLVRVAELEQYETLP